MPRPSFGITEYLALARDRDLVFRASQVPGSVKEKTDWQCMHCGASVHKSFHYLKYQEHGCRCQNGQNLPLEAYKELAEKLGITFSGLSVPRNIFEETRWLTKGETMILFIASYRQLGYGTIPARLQKYIKETV